MMRNFTRFSYFVSLILVLSLGSCHKFEGNQTVPAYLRIDTMAVVCDYHTYGATTHNFTDAWVYVDDNIVGCFELPATFPVLAEGPHKVSVIPGIKVNGISQTRSQYPFMAAAVFQDFNLVKDSIRTLVPQFTYYPNGDNLHVRWMEDFDGGSVSLHPTSTSDTTINRVSGPLAWHDPEGIHSTYSGKVVLTADSLNFCVASGEFDDLPTKGSACMLEMDYKCSDTCLVGLFYQNNSKIVQYPILRLRPTGESGVEPVRWNKIYVNIGPYCVENEGADYFKVYLSSWSNRNEGNQYFYFDNLKLIFRDR